MRTILRLQLVAAVMASLAATVASAQESRPAMVDSARALIFGFNERQSIDLLRRALNPALGEPDAAWERGVQLLGQTLLETNQREEAVAWLRWALRKSPSLQVDSVNFPPALVTAFQEARDFVAANQTDPRVSIQFQWSTSTASGGFGDLRVERAEGDVSNPLQLTVDGQFLDEGRARRLSPGSYRIAARSGAQSDAEFTTEVLPGVTTIVSVSVVSVNDGLSRATQSFVLSRIARLDLSQRTRSACKVGFVAANGLLLARYSAIRGEGQLTAQLAGGTSASNPLRIAAYDVGADLAVLSVTAAQTDSVVVAGDAVAGSPVWAAHFPACGDTPSLSAVSVAAVIRDSILLAQDAEGADQLGVLVDSKGAVTGLLTGSRSARALPGTSSLLATARANVASGRLLTAAQVAQEVLLAQRSSEPRGVSADGPKRRSMKLPIIGGIIAGGLVAALAMPKGSKPTTGGIVIRLP